VFLQYTFNHFKGCPNKSTLWGSIKFARLVPFLIIVVSHDETSFFAAIAISELI
jgi:hypothetical protein